MICQCIVTNLIYESYYMLYLISTVLKNVIKNEKIKKRLSLFVFTDVILKLSRIEKNNL